MKYELVEERRDPRSTTPPLVPATNVSGFRVTRDNDVTILKIKKVRMRKYGVEVKRNRPVTHSRFLSEVQSQLVA